MRTERTWFEMVAGGERGGCREAAVTSGNLGRRQVTGPRRSAISRHGMVRGRRLDLQQGGEAVLALAFLLPDEMVAGVPGPQCCPRPGWR